jgi:chaperone LolA
MRTQAARRRSLARLWPGALGLGLLGVAACAQAAPTPLDAYIDNLKTLRADFLQTLADAHGREIDRATGTLIVARPGKFSWEIHPQNPTGASSGTGQLMVCDGNNLWFLDRDLQQVTVKPVDHAGNEGGAGAEPERLMRAEPIFSVAAELPGTFGR